MSNKNEIAKYQSVMEKLLSLQQKRYPTIKCGWWNFLAPRHPMSISFNEIELGRSIRHISESIDMMQEGLRPGYLGEGVFMEYYAGEEGDNA